MVKAVTGLLIVTALGLFLASCKADFKDKMPSSQRQVIELIEKARNAYAKAPNEMVKDSVAEKAMSDRAKGICEAIGSEGKIDSWVGEISSLSSQGKGNGVLQVGIGSTVTLKTWNNDFSDKGDNTIIPNGSKLFEVLSPMKTGQLIKFSGSFVSGKGSCVRELSLTAKGSLEEPEYLFRFTDVTPVQ